jgi:hypothetical protein
MGRVDNACKDRLALVRGGQRIWFIKLLAPKQNLAPAECPYGVATLPKTMPPALHPNRLRVRAKAHLSICLTSSTRRPSSLQRAAAEWRRCQSGDAPIWCLCHVPHLTELAWTIAASWLAHKLPRRQWPRREMTSSRGSWVPLAYPGSAGRVSIFAPPTCKAQPHLSAPCRGVCTAILAARAASSLGKFLP